RLAQRALEEQEDVLIEQHRDDDDAGVQESLPPERGRGGLGPAQAERAQVPDGERGRQHREAGGARTPPLGNEPAAPQQEIQRERDQRQEPVNRHAIALQKLMSGRSARRRSAWISSPTIEKTKMSQYWPSYRRAPRRTPSRRKPFRFSALMLRMLY